MQAFYDQVKSQADVMVATGDAIATFEELQVLTPRCVHSETVGCTGQCVQAEGGGGH